MARLQRWSAVVRGGKCAMARLQRRSDPDHDENCERLWAGAAGIREDRHMSDVPGVHGVAEEDLFRWMVAASPDGLWVFYEHGLTVFANYLMGQLLGRAPD